MKVKPKDRTVVRRGVLRGLCTYLKIHKNVFLSLKSYTANICFLELESAE